MYFRQTAEQRYATAAEGAHIAPQRHTILAKLKKDRKGKERTLLLYSTVSAQLSLGSVSNVNIDGCSSSSSIEVAADAGDVEKETGTLPNTDKRRKPWKSIASRSLYTQAKRG